MKHTQIYIQGPPSRCVTWNPVGDASWWKGTRRQHSSSHSLFTLEETWLKTQQDRRSPCWLLFILFTLKTITKSKTSGVRSRASSKLMFANCVGYFDRAYYGFYVTSSWILVLIEGNKIWPTVELSECTVQIRSMWLWICMRRCLYWLDVILLTAV